MRVLDLDLDFFVDGAAHWKESDSERLSAEDYPPWNREEALQFLTEQCGLSAALPGFVVEHHGELFALWRDAIAAGRLAPPLEVTHVDAHADLGLGDSGYMHLMTQLLFEPVESRLFPRVGVGGLADGNWLIYAIACRWLSRLTYVLNTKEGPPGDIMAYVMEGFASQAANIQLAAMNRRGIEKLWSLSHPPPEPQLLEPKVPFSWVPWPEFRATEPFDVVCLARSPGFTPPESDALFDEIRERFIDETAWA